MARRYVQAPRKRRTREHVLADLSANHVERFALRCGFAVERITQDYGLDLALITFDTDGCLEGGVVWIQLKATDHLKRTRDRSAFVIRLDRRDVLAWIADANPVILVLYDAPSECAYWLCMQSYFDDKQAFAKLHNQTVTVAIPAQNQVTEEAMREFARLKAAALGPRGLRS